MSQQGGVERYFNYTDKSGELEPDIFYGPMSFIAPQATVEALRLEVQAAPPEDFNKIQTVIRDYTAYLMKNYGKFMVPDVLNKASRLAERLVLVDEPTMEMVLKLWQADHPNDLPKFIPGGWQPVSGEVLFLQYYSHQRALQLFPEGQDGLHRWMTKRGFESEEIALHMAGYWTMCWIGAHEVVHGLEGNHLTEAMGEAGAFYYGRETAEHFGIPPLVLGPEAKVYIQAYQHLVKKFGEEMHQRYFGAGEDWSKRAEMDNELGQMLNLVI